MTAPDVIPFAPDQQRALEAHWGALVGARAGGRAIARTAGVRPMVRASWQRSQGAKVAPDLPRAPLALEAGGVDAAVTASDWYAVAEGAVAQHRRTFGGAGHIIALFDHEARMLAADGDAAALEGLADINFRPGGLWAEGAVGTNGPGTALATGAPAHIVGAEHFCQGWQRWHCAAVPIRDAATGGITGVLDISGFREQAHPHTLSLALALAVAIEQTLAAREVERRFLVLQHFTALTARYPGDTIVAFDRGARAVGATPSATPELIEALAALVRRAEGRLAAPAGTPITIGPRTRALWFPVAHARGLAGGAFVLEGTAVLTGSEGIPFRPGEVRVYARRFFEAGARDLGRLGVVVEPVVYDALQAYHWPGSVRELKHVIRRVLQASRGTVTLRDLPHVIREAHAGTSDAIASAIDDEDAELMRVVHESRTMDEAAHKLGITRSTLYRRMERFGLKPKRVLGRG